MKNIYSTVVLFHFSLLALSIIGCNDTIGPSDNGPTTSTVSSSSVPTTAVVSSSSTPTNALSSSSLIVPTISSVTVPAVGISSAPVATSSAQVVALSSSAVTHVSSSSVVAQVVTITAPVASDLKVSGYPSAGVLLTVLYTYSDNEGDLEGATIVKWFRNGVMVAEVTGVEYTVGPNDKDAKLHFEITPVAQTGTELIGLTVSNIPLSVSGYHAPIAENVAVVGTTDLGGVLTGEYTYSDAEGNLEGGSTFRWLRDGTEIPGQTEITYSITEDDLGTSIGIEVTPIAQEGIPLSGLPAHTLHPMVIPAPIPNNAPLATSVSVSYSKDTYEYRGTYNYSDSENDLEGATRFQWYFDDFEIVGAEDSIFNSMDYDLLIDSLINEGKYTSVSLSVVPVAQTGELEGIAAQVTYTHPDLWGLVISGTFAVGETVEAQYTYFDPEGDDEGASLFDWYRGTGFTPIGEASGSTYIITADDVAAGSISVSVQVVDVNGIPSFYSYASTLAAQSSFANICESDARCLSSDIFGCAMMSAGWEMDPFLESPLVAVSACSLTGTVCSNGYMTMVIYDPSETCPIGMTEQ